MAKLSQKQIAMLGFGLLVLLVIVVLLVSNLRSATKLPIISLTVWGFDPPEIFDTLNQTYKAGHPNVAVQYTRVDAQNYEEELLSALAGATGPDIFMIPNRFVPKLKSIMSPADPNQFSIVSFRNAFPTAAEQDFVSGGSIYAAPLYLDTLALIYNRDLFDQAGVTSPPTTWSDFQNLVMQLRTLNQNNQLTRSAAAIGGSAKSMPYASDIISLLMLQNGTQMTDDTHSSAKFAFDSAGSPGMNAFNFYLQFANAGSPYYTWTDNGPSALDAFSGSKATMVFLYHEDLQILKNRSPFLHYGIASVPQTAANANLTYGKYAGFGVSKQSHATQWAWDYILQVTTNPDIAKKYSDASNRPPALRSLIQAKLNDPDMSVFARQALAARSWYEADPQKIDLIFNNAITQVLTGVADSRKSLTDAQDQVTQLMR